MRIICKFNFPKYSRFHIDCSIDVRTQLGNPSPLLITTSNHIVEPNRSGQVTIKNGKSLELYCSDRFAVPASLATATLVRATCLHDQMFELTISGGGRSKETTTKVESLLNVTCANHVRSTVLMRPTTTSETVQMASIGFAVTDRRFVRIFDVVYDNATLTSIYAQYNISASIGGGQAPNARIPFRKEGLFQCDCNTLYERDDQREAICQRTLDVGDRECDQWFGGAQKYLARGHLAASADFVYQFQQRATFAFANAAPQWQAINNGNWKSLEGAVRKRVLDTGRRVTVFTGTFGVLQLPNGRGLMRNIYLDAVQQQLPVPKYFYKLVIDGGARKGVAFVSVNSPYVSGAELAAEYSLCRDVSEDMQSWPDVWFERAKKVVRPVDRLTPKNIAKGYIYACEVTEFMNVVGHVPEYVRSLVGNGLLN